MGQRRLVAGRLEDRQRAQGAPLGLVGLPGHEQVPGGADEALAERDGILELLVESRRLAAGRDGVAEAMGVVELPPVAVEQVGALARRHPVQVRAHRLVVRERLPVRPGALGLPRRARPDGEDRLDVARLDGMVHHARGLGARLRAQRRHHGGVEAPPPQRREAALDRPPGELVPEREAVRPDVDHAGVLGLRERVDPRPQQLGGEVEAGVRRHDGQLVERLAAVVAEPADAGQHGLHHGRGHGVARRRERLGDEERVAARDAVDRLRVGAGAGGQPPHGLSRQRRELEPVHRAAREHAEQALERVARDRPRRRGT